MPSGRVHDKTTIIGAVAAAPVYWFGSPVGWHSVADVGAFVGATLISGLLLSPDLDLDSSIYRRWGPLRFLWWPYQKVIHHRSVLSHSFVLGPILRIAYFLFWVWALFRVVSWAFAAYVHPFDRNGMSVRYADGCVAFCRAHPPIAVAAGIGLLFGTALHVGADLLVTRWKRRVHGGHRGHRSHRSH